MGTLPASTTRASASGIRSSELSTRIAAAHSRASWRDSQVALGVPFEGSSQVRSTAERARVLELGLREWRISRALEAYGRGHGSLAFAAE